MSWNRAIHFKTWADTQNARHMLPLLIRRLIRAVTPRDSHVVVPAMEQVQRPGLDGIVESDTASQFVPSGKSAWEIGVSTDKKGKAEADFQKRTEEMEPAVQRETTFVFVTPREWRNKDEWAEEKKAASDWRDVRVLDANDLEHWIELCPAVDIWFATENGRRPAGVVDLESHWKGLSAVSTHILLPSLFLVGRSQLSDSLKQWLECEPNSALLSCDNAWDTLDYLSAFVREHIDDETQLKDLIVVQEGTAWDLLAASIEPLVLASSPSLSLRSEQVSAAVNNGHHVLICGSRATAPLTMEFELPRQDTYEMTKELENCGFDDATARSKALASCGSSSILKRQLTKHPESSFPDWATKHGAQLAPFALLGGWVHVDPSVKDIGGLLPSNRPIDLTCIEDFMGLSPAQLEEHVIRWTESEDSLFLRFRDHIVVSSREDAWFLLGGAVTPDLLNRFEELATLVLEEDDPALEMDSKDRWLANIYGKTHGLSHELRQGILESLVLMATYPVSGASTFGLDFGACVRRILAKALPEGASWKRWATFDRQLELFAEADPDFLLSRLEEDLTSTEPQVPRLFVADDGGFTSSSYQCGLLWALEKMAWSPSLLPRVTNVLGLLVKIEGSLPDNVGNRPFSTLEGIFLWWLSYTNASIDDRISCICQLLQNHSTVGWKLLRNLLPSGYQSVAHPSQLPRWRNWADGWTRQKAHSESYEYAYRIAGVVLEHAGHCPRKWSQILDGIFRYDSEVAAKALKALHEIGKKSQDEDGKSQLWQEIRELTSRHSAHAGANWSFDQELLSELSEILQSLTPTDPIVLNDWLFDYHPDLPGIDTTEDFDRYNSELESRQVSALQEIIAQRNLDGVTQLLTTAKNAQVIGWLLGRERIIEIDQNTLASWLESEDADQRQAASSYVAGRFNAESLDYLSGLSFETMQPQTAAYVLCSVPFEREVWDWVEENTSASLKGQYWKSCKGWAYRKSNEDVSFIIEKLLESKRPFSAADTLQMSMSDRAPEKDLVFQVLEAGLSATHNEQPVQQLDSYATQELIGYLQRECDSDELDRLAKVEWGFLPVLDRHHSKVGPETLLSELSNSPEMFIDLITVVYRAENAPLRSEPLTEQQQSHCRLARKLLEAFTRIPGMGNEGDIDESTLREWTSKVRELAHTKDRSRVTDLELGRLFATAPKSDGVSWPPESLCRVMEETKSEKLYEGFSNGIMNGRGITSRMPTTGGEPERDLSTSYRRLEERHRIKFPKLSKSFQHLATYYDHIAEREDEDALRRRLER